MSWTSPLTALSHLSDEAVAAFADGVLSDAARARAQSHMAGCGECSAAVYGQRAARAALRAASTPSLPAGLFERLRELPITTELPAVCLPSALSSAGEPLFAPTDRRNTPGGPGAAVAAVPPTRAAVAAMRPTRDADATMRPAPAAVAVVPAAAEPAVRPGPAATTSTAPLTAPIPTHPNRLLPAGPTAGHRRTSTRVGLGATAAAVLAVGVLATTAANAGGVTSPSRTVRPAGDSPNSTTTGPASLEPAGSAHSAVQMTLLSVPTSGR